MFGGRVMLPPKNVGMSESGGGRLFELKKEGSQFLRPSTVLQVFPTRALFPVARSENQKMLTLLKKYAQWSQLVSSRVCTRDD